MIPVAASKSIGVSEDYISEDVRMVAMGNLSNGHKSRLVYGTVGVAEVVKLVDMSAPDADIKGDHAAMARLSFGDTEKHVVTTMDKLEVEHIAVAHYIIVLLSVGVITGNILTAKH